jgi:Fe-S cluster assembly protein SufD
MTNRNLLLTDKASVNSKPELEIYADDVKASHGTTVGQLDEQSIFYMRSRGLNRPNAERMLTSAFAVDVLAELSSDYLTTLFMDRLEARLNKVIGVEGDE